MIRTSWIRIRSRSYPRVVFRTIGFRFDFGLVGASTYTLIPFLITDDRIALELLDTSIINLTPWRL